MAENTPVEIAYAIKEVRTIYFGARIHELASKQSTHLAVGIGGWVCGVALLVLSPPLAIIYLLALTIRLCSARIFFEGLLPSSNLKLLNTCHKTRAAEALTLLTTLKSYKKEGHFSHFQWQLRA
jgi:hypothetical protein